MKTCHSIPLSKFYSILISRSQGIGIHLISSTDTSYKSFLNLLFVNILPPFESMGSIKSVVCLMTLDSQTLEPIDASKLFIVYCYCCVTVTYFIVSFVFTWQVSLILSGEMDPSPTHPSPYKVYPFDSEAKLAYSFLSLRSYDNLRSKIYPCLILDYF